MGDIICNRTSAQSAPGGPDVTRMPIKGGQCSQMVYRTSMVHFPTLRAQFSKLLCIMMGNLISNTKLRMRIRGGSSTSIECHASTMSVSYQGKHGLYAFPEPLRFCKSLNFQNIVSPDHLSFGKNANQPVSFQQFAPVGSCVVKGILDTCSKRDEIHVELENSLRSSSPSSDPSLDVASTHDAQVRTETRRWMEFKNARDFVRRQGYRLRSEFWMWKMRPRDIPYNPDKAYKYEGWMGASVR